MRIGTHSGTFHADEALGCFLLRRTGEFRGAEIVRSRDPEVLGALDCLVDVGGEYDPPRRRFDHHQRGFAETFGHGFTTKLSSAGLVYKHYGREIVSQELGLDSSDPQLDTVYLAVYKQFMEAVDGVDNGVSQWDAAGPPRYISNTSLSSRVSFLNPQWNEDESPERQREGFDKAMALTGEEFLECLNYTFKVWLPARTIVEEAMRGRAEVHPGGQVVRLPQYCPWKEHLYDLEKDLAVERPILYVLYTDQSGKWRIQCVSKSPGSFENRKSMPAAWAGLRDGALDEASGIPGCMFVHAGRFTGGNATYEGVLQMAIKSLESES